MIHIVTVHWKDDRWVDLQLKYFEKNIKMPYKVYAFLNFLPQDHQNKYFYSSTEDIQSHAIKLNLLADMAILNSTNEDDWLMFIDGDAFPIGDIESFSRSKLEEFPLLAIQRKENLGDIQPHPSFCITTIKFWKEIRGDWKTGYQWKNSNGKMVSDVGGNLLATLDKNNIQWLPLLRSNKKDLHKLWFGLYDDLIYHHGAGFRDPTSRIDKDAHTFTPPSWLFNNKILIKISKELHRGKNRQNKMIAMKENQILSEKVFQSILKDLKFYQIFQRSN